MLLDRIVPVSRLLANAICGRFGRPSGRGQSWVDLVGVLGTAVYECNEASLDAGDLAKSPVAVRPASWFRDFVGRRHRLGQPRRGIGASLTPAPWYAAVRSVTSASLSHPRLEAAVQVGDALVPRSVATNDGGAVGQSRRAPTSRSSRQGRFPRLRSFR